VSDVRHRPGVYRLFRADDVLLYVGSADRWGLRMSQHERQQPWWLEVAYMTFEECESRKAAYLVEDIAIATEAPLYNKRRNFADKAEEDDDGAPTDGRAILVLLPAAYLLGKWAARSITYQFMARRALLSGGEALPPVVNPFDEDRLANKWLVAALNTPFADRPDTPPWVSPGQLRL
jgi:hypothetical protein